MHRIMFVIDSSIIVISLSVLIELGSKVNLKYTIVLVLLISFLICFSSFSLGIGSVRASPRTIIVPDNYATIQEAINNANNGDTVFVKDGTYLESSSITIDRSISLLGQDKENTIIEEYSIYYHVLIVQASNVTIKGFTLSDGFAGCRVLGSGCLISDNNFINDDEGISVDESVNIVSNNLFIGCRSTGITVFESDNNLIDSNIVQNGGFVGVYVFSGNNNTIVGNEIINNNDAGLILDISSSDNFVRGNNISNNGWIPWLWGTGVVLWIDTNSNQIVFNNISDNKCGLMVGSTGINEIYHDSFINNQVQVIDERTPTSINLWDNGYPSGGNYWSDYAGVDQKSGPYQNLTGSDGIGDTSYIINNNNTDRYPLMKPYVLLIGDINQDGKVDIKDISIVASAFGTSLGDPRWNPAADVNQDGRVDIRDVAIVAKNFGEH